MAGESARAVAVRRRAKAEALLLSADAFERGAVGEESTARALAALPSLHWRSFHDVAWPGRKLANIDHVLVGPTGVFVVDTKAWSGRVEVVDGVLRQDGRRRDRAVSGAVDAAAAVGALVPCLEGDVVQPVLCLARDEPVLGWAGEVMVCSTANIATLLASRPAVLDERAVAGVAEGLATLLRAANDPVTPVDPARLMRGRRRPTAVEQKRARVRSAVGTVLTGAALVLALVLGLPWVVPAAQRVLEGTGAPAVAMGATHTVMGNPLRPELVLGVERLEPVRLPRGARPASVPPGSLMAATVTIRNTGFGEWTARGHLDVLLAGPGRERVRPLAGVTRLRSGRVLPADVTLKPGQAVRGAVVFAVPADITPAAVHVGVGPGLTRTVAWRVPDGAGSP